MAEDFAIEAFVLLGIPVVAIVIRTVARWLAARPNNFQLDDYMMPLAGVVYGLETDAAYFVGAWWMGLANNSMTDVQRATIPPDSEEYHLRVGGSKTQVIGWSLYTTLLWLLKACMAIFYSRLTDGLTNMRARVRFAYVFIATTYIADILSILLGCRPMRKNWQIYPNPGNYCQPAVSHIDVYVTVTLNVATDLYLITILTPMLFKARLPWREKLELLVLFSGGIFVMAAGILRCVLIITLIDVAGRCKRRSTARQLGLSRNIRRRKFRRIARHSGWYMSHLTTYKQGMSSQSYPLSEGNVGDSTMHSKRRKFRHPLSIPDKQWLTISDEQMVLPRAGERMQPAPDFTVDWGRESRSSYHL